MGDARQLSVFASVSHASLGHSRASRDAETAAGTAGGVDEGAFLAPGPEVTDRDAEAATVTGRLVRDRDKAPGSAGPGQVGVVKVVAVAVTADAHSLNLAGPVRERPGDQVVTAGLGQNLEGIGKLGRAKVAPSGDGLLPAVRLATGARSRTGTRSTEDLAAKG
jgi:hypothetical protein